MTTYYADLNPRFPSRYERRWAVFLKREGCAPTQTHLRFANRKAAERKAAILTEQERDLEVEQAAIDRRRARQAAQQPTKLLMCGEPVLGWPIRRRDGSIECWQIKGRGGFCAPADGVRIADAP